MIFLEDLKKKDDYFRLIVENARDLFTILNDEYDHEYINERAHQEILGYDKSDLIGKKFWDFIHPEDIKRIFKTNTLLTNDFKGIKRIDKAELRIRHKNGYYVWIEYTCEVLIDNQNHLKALLISRDISERKKAEQILTEREKKFRSIVESLPIAVLLYQNYECVYENPAAEKLTKYTIEELRSMKFYEFVHPDYRNLIIKIGEALEKNEKYELKDKIIIINKTGSEIWIKGRMELIEYEGKRAALLAMINITDLKKTEQKLKESEEKFRNITEQFILGIGILQDGILKYVNHQAADIFEYTIEEMMDWSAPEFVKTIYPSDLQMELDLIEKVLIDPPTEKVQFQARGVKKSGEICWADISIKKIKYEGRPAILGVFIDITDRKKAEAELEESEERYRLISENSGAVVWSTDMNLNITYVSPSSPKILGYTVEESMSLPINARVTHASIKIMADILRDELKLERKKEKNLNRSRTFETEQIHKNGSIVPVEMTITFLRDRTAKAIGILGVSRDITERKKADQKLRESEEKYRNAFERANFYKDLFAHDINNVLATILSALELNNLYLNQPSNLSQIKELLQIQKTAVMKGTNLIANVRKLDEIENAEIAIMPTNLFEVLKKSIDFVKNSFPLKNVKFDIKTLETDIMVNANELLEDVFENIMINSVKYNENNLIEINIKLSKQQLQKNNFIKAEFIDNGFGISDDRKKIIFQSGFMEKKGSRGLGFGLSLVKKILDKYNGLISVENRVKEDYTKGSNFIVLLPESI